MNFHVTWEDRFMIKRSIEFEPTFIIIKTTTKNITIGFLSKKINIKIACLKKSTTNLLLWMTYVNFDFAIF